MFSYRPFHLLLATLLALIWPASNVSAQDCQPTRNAEASDVTVRGEQNLKAGGCDPFGPPTGTPSFTHVINATGTVTFNWGTYAGHISAGDPLLYRIRKKATPPWINIWGENTWTTPSALGNGPHTYELQGCNIPVANGCSGSTEELVIIEAPPSIAFVNAERLGGSDQVRVSWDTSNTNPGLIGYIVEFTACDIDGQGNVVNGCHGAQSPGTFCFGDPPDEITGPDCTNTVAPYRQYKFYVSGDGASQSSDPLDIMNPPGPPSVVTFSGSVTTNGQKTLNWNPPTNGAGTVSYYLVEGRRVAIGAGFSGAYSAVSCTGGQVTTTTCNAINLIEGDWQFRVSAVNTLLEGVPSSPSARLTSQSPPPNVGTVSALQGSGATEDKITVSWAHVGGNVEEYRARYLAAPNTDPVPPGWITVPVTGGTVSRVFNVVDANAHYFEVEACNATCSATATASRTPLFATPSAPTGLTATSPTNVLAQTFTWSSTSAVADYVVATIASTDGSGWSLTPDTDATSPWTVDVPADGTYAVTVKACNEAPVNPDPCSGTVSVSVSVNTQPTIAYVNAERLGGSDQVRVSWDTSDTNPGLIGYIVEFTACDIDGQGNVVNGCHGAQSPGTFCFGDPPDEITGPDCTNTVAPYRQYKFYVSGDGASQSSDPLDIMNPPGPPSVVTFSGSVTTNGQKTLNWNPPTNGAGTVSYYLVEGRRVAIGAGFSGAYSAVSCTGGQVTTTTCNAINLIEGDWQFRVSAVNTLLEGVPSPASARLTSQSPPPNVGTVSALQGSGATEDKITVSWAHVGGNVEEYRARYLAAPNTDPVPPGWITVPVTGGTVSRVFNVVDANAHYFEVEACNATCSATATASRTPLFATPSAPTGLTATSPTNVLAQTFTWSATSAVADYVVATIASTDGSGWSLTPDTDATSPWTADVPADGTYAVTVKACNEAPVNPDPCSGTVSVSVSVNTQPTIAYVNAERLGGSDQVRVSWDTSDTNPGLIGYIVEFTACDIDGQGNVVNGCHGAQSPGTFCFGDPPDEITGPDCTNTVAPYRQYKFYVSGDGATQSSDPLDIMNPPGQPGPIIALTPNSNNGQATLDWADSSGPVARYIVESRRAGTDSPFIASFEPQLCDFGAAGLASSRCDVVGLASGDWQFRVRAENGPVGAPLTTSFTAPANSDPRQLRVMYPPGVATNPRFSDFDIEPGNTQSSGGFVLEWDAPASGDRVDGYVITEMVRQIDEDDTFPSGDVFTVSIFDFDSPILDLSANPRAGGVYHYQIRAFNELNPAAANPLLVSSEIIVLNAIAAPTDVIVDNDGVNTDGDISVSWQAPAGNTDPLTYRLLYCLVDPQTTICGAAVPMPALDTSATTQLVTLANIPGDGLYRFRVQGQYLGNFGAQSALSATVQVQLPPTAVTGLDAVQETSDENSILVSWESADGDVETYRVQALPESGATPDDQAWQNVADNVFSLSFPVVNDDTHYFVVQACNASCGPATETSTNVVFATPGVPTAVQSIGDADSVNLEFEWVSTDPSTDYHVVEMDSDSGEWSLPARNIGEATSWGVTVPGNDTYTFRVKACNSVPGDAPCSAYASTDVVVESGGNSGTPGWAAKDRAEMPDAPFSELPVQPIGHTVGKIDASGGVSGGQAFYKIPIKVVPGRSGMQPDVSIEYSSSAGNGSLGVGWSLNAGGSISRCSSTVAQDNVRRNVAFTTSDKLCMNGERLVAVSGTYGASGAEYRTELDQLARITQTGSINSGSSSFMVERKNGMVEFYGTTSDSGHTPGTRLQNMSWALAKRMDPSGNTIEYRYAEFGQGEHLLTDIIYTGFNATPGNRYVRFNYENRVDGQGDTDYRSRYHLGDLSATTQRLASVKTMLDITTVRTYNLAYQAHSSYSGQTLLRGIEECGYHNGSEYCLPETQFNWHEGAPRFKTEPLQFEVNGTFTPILQDQRWLHEILPHGDSNGDGVKDFVGIYSNAEGVKTGDNTIDVANCYRPFNAFQLTCLEADFNVDGRTDSFRKGGGQLQTKITGSDSWHNTGILWGSGFPDASLADHPIAFSDFNADGWVDIAFKQDQKLWIFFHTKSLTAPYYSAGNKQFIREIPDATAGSLGGGSAVAVQVLGDMDGNGTADFVIGHNSNPNDPPGLPNPKEIIQIYPNGSNPVGLSTRTVVTASNSLVDANFFHDLNGDGLPDLLGLTTPSGYVSYKINNGTSFDSTWKPLGLELPIREGTYEQDSLAPEVYTFVVMSKILVMDYDRDGRDDFLVAKDVVASGCARIEVAMDGLVWKCDEELYQTYQETPYAPVEAQINSQILDNSIRRYTAYRIAESVNGNFGVGTITGSAITASASQTATADINGDGLVDIVTAFGCRLPQCEFNEDTSSREGTVQNSAALYDAGARVIRNLGSEVEAYNEDGFAFQLPDKLRSVVDGFGMEHQWEYKPLSSDAYDVSIEGSTAPFYEADHAYVNGGEITATDKDHFHFASDFNVVAEHRSTHGGLVDSGGDGTFSYEPRGDARFNSTLYRYSGATFNNKGRGFLGFRSIVSEDVSTGTKQKSIFDQKWPRTSALIKSCSWLSGESETISPSLDCASPIVEKDLTYQFRTTIGGTEALVPFSTVTKTYDLTTRSNLLNQSGELYEEYDGYLNLKRMRTVSWDPGLGRYEALTEKFFTSTIGNWWLNKVDSESVTRKRVTDRPALPVISDASLDPYEQVTTTSYLWNGTHRKHSSIATAGGSTTTKTYTPYGQEDSVTITANTNSSDNRTTQLKFQEGAYFPYQTWNALDHVTAYDYDERFGVVTQSTDPNSLVNVSFLDAFGRVAQTIAPGVPNSYATLEWCDTTCATGAVTRLITRQSGSPTSVTDLDMYGRTLRTWKEGPTGGALTAGAVEMLKHFDRDGYVRFESIPHFTGSGRHSIGTRYELFDPLGRVLQKSVDQATAGRFTTTYAFNGHTTDIYAANLHLSRTYDSANRLIRTVDALSGTNRFAYDGSGNPIVIEDANQNQIVSKYDHLNRKEYVLDPNMGRKDFGYNLIGEVNYERDASGNEVRYRHDKLGRITDRYLNTPVTGDPDAIWRFDSYGTDTFYGGLLYEAKVSGNTTPYGKRHYLDSLGRPYQTEYVYSTRRMRQSLYTSYDANYGRVKSIEYPTGIVVGTEYTPNGYALRDVNASSQFVYKQFLEMDAYGNVVRSQANANTLEEDASFHQNTGQMESVEASANGNLLHSLAYQSYDVFGNITQRETLFPGEEATETFGYDDLHRLTSSSRSVTDLANGSSTPLLSIDYDYDATGNLLLKSDFGTDYQYVEPGDSPCSVASGPNAVKRVTSLGGSTLHYCYDERGNLISRNGAGINYTAYNQPNLISSSTFPELFSYGPNNELTMRWSISLTGSSFRFHLDKKVEVINSFQNGNQSEFRHYLGDYAIISESVDRTPGISTVDYKLSYLHRDRLGSIVTITDENNAVSERRSFDPFGKPREGSWHDRTPAVLDSALTDRGFTDHTHIDIAEVIHMNGRVYDYNLGRFLSVDPFIQKPGDSQSINPYSYIMNNPLAGIDPTGYQAEPARDTSICGAGDTCGSAFGYWKVSKTLGSGSSGEKGDTTAAAPSGQPANGAGAEMKDPSKRDSEPGAEPGSADEDELGYPLLNIGALIGTHKKKTFPSSDESVDYSYVDPDSISSSTTEWGPPTVGENAVHGVIKALLVKRMAEKLGVGAAASSTAGTAISGGTMETIALEAQTTTFTADVSTWHGTVYYTPLPAPLMSVKVVDFDRLSNTRSEVVEVRRTYRIVSGSKVLFTAPSERVSLNSVSDYAPAPSNSFPIRDVVN